MSRTTYSSVGLLSKTIANFCFGTRTSEVVGIDIGNSNLHLVTISAPKTSSPVNTSANDENVLGISIQRNSDKARTRLNWESRASTEFPNPLTQFSDSAGSSPPSTNQLVKTVRQNLPRQIDSGRRPICAVLPNSATVLRWPNAEHPAELVKSIRTDLGRALNGTDPIESCSWPLGKSGRKMIYAVSGGMTAALAQLFSNLGYQNPVVDSRPHALARALQLDAGQETPTQSSSSNIAKIIIEWSSHDCTLLITNLASNSHLHTLDRQTTSWNLPHLCRPLHGYSLSASDRIGSNPAGIAKTKNHITRNRGNYIPLFRAAAEEIDRTLRFAENALDVSLTGPIVICGSAANIPGLCQVLSEGLNREVRAWRWGGTHNLQHHDLEPDQALFAVAIGTACGAFT